MQITSIAVRDAPTHRPLSINRKASGTQPLGSWVLEIQESNFPYKKKKKPIPLLHPNLFSLG